VTGQGLTGRFRQAWQDASARVEQAAPAGTRRRFDPASWGGALLVMLLATAVLWVVQGVNHHQRLDRFGLRPRSVDGLWGVLTAPFLHPSWDVLISTTLPFLLIGWAVLIGGVRNWAIGSVAIIVVGGALTWLVGPSHLVLGATGLVFGWIGYLLTRAWFSRRLSSILIVVVVLAIFGTLLGQLVPDFDKHSSWQANACSFVVGLVAGGVLPLPRRRVKRP